MLLARAFLFVGSPSFTPIELFAFFQLTTSWLIVALKLAHKARIQKQGGFPQGFCRQVPRKPRPLGRGASLLQQVNNAKGKKSL